MRKREMKPGKFVALTLSKDGSTAFTYLKGGQEGQREIYFVNKISTGAITEATMLLGQFLFEFEGAPKDALPMIDGCTNRIYFPKDKRVTEYNHLTDEEKEAVKNRLAALAARLPEFSESISNLIQKM